MKQAGGGGLFCFSNAIFPATAQSAYAMAGAGEFATVRKMW